MSRFASQRAFLLSSFADIAEALSLDALGGEFPDYMISMYRETGRFYHNADHLFHVISELHRCPGPLDPCVGLALWFHDAIYDATRDDNEARCVHLAGLFAKEIKLSPEPLARVQRLIKATDHRTPPQPRMKR
jgi:predicted metal-dependent HD superfamily phosphohydrolase